MLISSARLISKFRTPKKGKIQKRRIYDPRSKINLKIVVGFIIELHFILGAFIVYFEPLSLK